MCHWVAVQWQKMDRVLTVDQERGYTSPPRRSPFLSIFFCTPTTSTSEVKRENDPLLLMLLNPIHHSSFQCLILSWKGNENGGGGGSGRQNKFLKQQRSWSTAVQCVPTCFHYGLRRMLPLPNPVGTPCLSGIYKKKKPFPMTDGGSLMALRMGTSIMLAAAVNPALWHLLTRVSTSPREMDDFTAVLLASRTSSFDICVP